MSYFSQSTKETVLKNCAENGIVVLGEYVAVNERILVRCPSCQNEWSPRAGSLVRGSRYMCQKCVNSDTARKQRVIREPVAKKLRCLVHEEFARRVAILSPTIRIDSRYTTRRQSVDVTCLVCNLQWAPVAGQLAKGHGCSRCIFKQVGEAQRLTHDEFISRMARLNNSVRIDGVYQVNTTHVAASCLKCGYRWNPIAATLLRGSGCPKCAKYGFQIGKPGILYYLRIANPSGGFVFKIGITNRSVAERFGKKNTTITILETVYFANGEDALKMEQETLREFASFRYSGPNILRIGNEELFTTDVFNIDQTSELALAA